MTYSYERKRIS
jgi:hypothetical protein